MTINYQLSLVFIFLTVFLPLNALNWTKTINSIVTLSDFYNISGLCVTKDGDGVVAEVFIFDNRLNLDSKYSIDKEIQSISLDQANLPDITVQCELTPPIPTANGGTISGTSNVAFPIKIQGTTIVTWTYDDGNGNTVTQTQNIIITDTTAPILSFNNPSDALIDSCATEVIVPSPIISENCSTNTTLDFDGSNDRVIIPYSASLGFTTEFSVQAWIYPRANQYSRILTQYSASGNNSGEFVFDTYDGSNPTYLANGRGLRLVFTGTDGGAVMSSNVLNLNSWNHVAGTFNNGVLKLYVNGVEVNSGNTTYTSIPTATIDLAIGEDINVGAYEFFNGQIDELSIWNRALKPAEIANGYNKLLVGTEPGLVAYFDFEEGTGSSVLIDKSGSGNDGTLTNMNQNSDWVTSTTPITMASITNDFNGTSDASGSYPEGETTVTWTATDANGNTNTLQQIINAGDTEAPSITFSNPSDASITTCDTNVTIPSPIVSDNCSVNTALVFDGTNDYINLGSPLLSPSNGSQAQTVEMWVKATPNNTITILLSQYGWNQLYEYRSNLFIDTVANGGNLVFFKGSYVNIEGTTNLLDNQWHHIAMVKENSGELTLFVDGVVEAVGLDTYPYSNTNTLLGGQTLLPDSYYNGIIDEFRIWNIARTQTQIANSFNANVSDSESGLVAYYKFEDGTGSGVISDDSNNSNDGTLINMDVNTVWVQSTAPVPSVTLTNDFNGTSDASGTYPDGETMVTWTAIDANGNQSTLEQIINIHCSITYEFNNDVWSPNNPSGVATVLDDIIITSGDAIIDSNSSANTVTVEAGASLTLNAALTATDITLNSTSNSYSSLLTGVSGSVSGTINYNRFVNSNSLGNDLISSPLSGETWSNFLSPENATALLDNGGTPTIYAFAPFDKTSGNYENYNVNTTANLTSGIGYRAATDSGETLNFTGTIPDAVNVNIMDSGPNFTQWNLVGNPYPSYINVHAFLNHEVDLGVSNIDLFANGSAAIYGYNASTENKWTIYNLANTNTSTLIVPGQGFYVAADASQVAAYDLEFTTDMQTTGANDDFILGRNAGLIYLKLALSSSTKSYYTEFYFNDDASQGLDKGYDAELWGTSDAEFIIYSQLVLENTGNPIALQTLNTSDLTEVSIPLGVNVNQGEQIQFSIAETTLPNSVNVYLDDVLMQTSTLLNNESYSIVPLSNISGTGRFFLRTTEEALSIGELELDELKVYYLKDFSSLFIEGKITNNTEVDIYDLQGRVVLTMPLDSDVFENRINLSSFITGLYLVKIRSNSQQKFCKILVHND